AGLRSFDILSPFPEEANRKITSQISALHLPPTTVSRDNLLREAVAAEDVYVTGNTVIDALLEAVGHQVPFEDERLAELEASGRRVVLVT
ncbi:UDP-N-acetylglucosamine 2-epimerase (non-hydrolyzing), partial [Xanthomonas citri pv. citri]|nr:UDP-N-acetylglucosamine 2-epimerase (non-hydrolyzing) [Xanthomonas citri pv. citri]